jgi:hypothetical protein
MLLDDTSSSGLKTVNHKIGECHPLESCRELEKQFLFARNTRF